jgi:hypothetical protein
LSLSNQFQTLKPAGKVKIMNEQGYHLINGLLEGLEASVDSVPDEGEDLRYVNISAGSVETIDESVRRLKGAGLIIDELSQNSIDEPGEGPRLYLRGFMTNRNVDHPVIKREHLRYEDVRSTTGADSGSILGPG